MQHNNTTIELQISQIQCLISLLSKIQLRNYPTHNTIREFTNTTANNNQKHQGRILIFPKWSCQAQSAKVTPCSYSSVENLETSLKIQLKILLLCVFSSQ